MKILTANQIRAADQYTITHEPVAPIDLMERAAKQCVKWLQSNINSKASVYVFCGPGNNGGDGLVITRYLAAQEFDVRCFYFASKTASPLFIENLNRLLKPAIPIQTLNDFPLIKEENAVLIDALFGSGLNRPLDGIVQKLIAYLNTIKANKISIDIPSGMFTEFNASNICFEATHTLSFELPKLAFLLPEKGNLVGCFHLLHIGLHPHFLETVKTPYFFTTKEKIQTLLKPLKTFAHKGTQGHLLLIGGKENSMGAMLLSGKAALYSGLGKLTLLTPQCGQSLTQTKLPEAILHPNEGLTILEGSFDTTLTHFALGPSMGTAPKTVDFLANLLHKAKHPLVVDADALNILAQNPLLQKQVPPGSILTPHPKELERWVGPWQGDQEKIEKVKSLSADLKAIVVLKGAYTMIAFPEGTFWFNSTGNPGMATAGCGDVLTGIIGSLLAQGYVPKEAAIIGVFIHGLAGDIAAKKQGKRAVIASSIVEYIPMAFKSLEINT